MALPLHLVDAFHTFGPAFLVSVAYLDPGNWATAIEGGSRFGYQLIWVVVISNLIALLLQVLAARLGIVSGKDLAEVCREAYSPSICALLWFLSEISIIALDLTMVLGMAVGLNLLFGIPLLSCIVLTSLDFVLILIPIAPAKRERLFELCTVCIVGMVLACFAVDVTLSAPPPGLVMRGLIPSLDRDSIYTAVSLLGANVMPHNFYLHSALVKGRKSGNCSLQERCRLNLIDVALALGVALMINLSVLVVSASTFHSAGIVVETLQAAHDLMEQLLSSRTAPAVFGLALLLTSQLSTFTGAISGHVVLHGFLNRKMSLWLLRLLTRLAAIIPAAALQILYGDKGTYKMLVIAQVVLAIQLPFTLIPLIKATSDRRRMGPFANSLLVQLLSWSSTALIFLANFRLFFSIILPSNTIGLHGMMRARWMLLEGSPTELLSTGVSLVAVVVSIAMLVWMIITPLSKSSIPNPLLLVHDIPDEAVHGSLEEIVLKQEPPACRLTRHPDRGLGRGARKAFSSILEDFWSQCYDLYGQQIGIDRPVWDALTDCLLAIHRLDNASAAFADEGGSWASVQTATQSMMHLSMEQSVPLQLPIICHHCSIQIVHPSTMTVEAARPLEENERVVFVFGLWSMKQLMMLCSNEPRPDLWGKYSAVLNRLQWLLPYMPCTVDHVCISKDDVLHLLSSMERHVTEKKGQRGTSPAATAYPKVMPVYDSTRGMSL